MNRKNLLPSWINSDWIKLGLAYLIWRIWLLLAAGVAFNYVPSTPGYLAQVGFGENLPAVWWSFANMDGVVFMTIAKFGYSAGELPFFPLFPLSIRLAHFLTQLPWVMAGQLVSLLAFGGAVWFMYKLLAKDKLSSLFALVFLLLLTYPTGHYYSAVYNDSLFLLFASSTLYFGRQKKWLLAVITGALASLTRLNGVALAVYLAVEYLQEFDPKLTKLPNWWRYWTSIIKAVDPREWFKKWVWLILVIPGGFLSYLAWIQLKFGDWYLFFSGVQVWHRDQLTFPLQTLWRYVRILTTVAPNNLVYFVAFAEFAFAMFYLAMLVWSFKWMRASYWWFFAMCWLIPTMTGTLQGMPRYGLHIFPLFLAIAVWLENKPRWLQTTWLLAGLALQFVYLALFTRGYFVA